MTSKTHSARRCPALAYLATVPPVRHKVPASVCGSEQADPLVEGKAYVTNRPCAACHKANLGGRLSCKAGEPANLTSTGLGGWSEKQIITAIRTGVDDDGKMLSSDVSVLALLTQAIDGVTKIVCAACGTILYCRVVASPSSTVAGFANGERANTATTRS